MVIYYLDASALVKYYIREPGSAWVRALVDARLPDSGLRANQVLMSEASIAECAAAFAILNRTRRISRKTRDGAFRAFMRHISGEVFYPLPVRTSDFQFAAHLTQRHPLKAYDAVQLAVALRYARILAAFGLPLVFVSGDAALLAAARAEGLPTENPFDHVAPEDTQTPS
jgi:predicted nucleic acid-binding protein